MPGRWPAFAMGAAFALIALGAFGDVLVAHPFHLGPFQWLCVAAGALLLPLGLLSGTPRRRHAAAVSVLASSYATLLAFELALHLAVGPSRNATFALTGVYRPAPWGGYEMIPSWHGVYDDTLTRAAVDLNSLGDRDDEPDAQPRDAARLVVLLGDSQTFGMGLAREATIERQIETRSAGRVAAYNLGVPGYGPWDALEHYRVRPLPAARAVFFLLYGNDLRIDNCRADYHTAVDGFIVPRARPDGTPYGEDELRERVQAARNGAAPTWNARLESLVLLEELRGRVRLLRDPEPLLLPGAPEDFSEACADGAAEAAGAMRALARERGQQLTVVVLPTAVEAALHRHGHWMERALERLSRLALPTVDLLPRLSGEDYLPRDEHLAASGARKVAEAILEQAG